MMTWPLLDVQYAMARRKKRSNVSWKKAEDITENLHELLDKVDISWVQKDKIYCVRSTGSTARAYARIWGMNRIWQETLGLPPSYCIEVISEHFDSLSKRKQDEVLLHELAHIPKNFSGALVAHTHHRKGSFHDKLKGFLSAYRRK